MFKRSIRLLAAIGLLFAAATPAAASWLRAESEHFIVYSESNEATLRRQVLMLEDFDALLRLLTDVRSNDPVQKLPVYLVRSNGELRQVARVGTSVGGFYYPSSRGIAAFINAGLNGLVGEYVGPNEVLFHEYAHHFMMQFHSNAYPTWYVEGFAEYLGTARFVDQHVEIGRASDMRTMVLSNRANWIPFEWILFQRERVPDQARFYSQSWILTHYLLSDDTRRQQLVAYLNALARREQPRAAFRASFGMDPGQMQTRIERYATQPLRITRLDRSSVARPPQIAITRLPASADQLLLTQAALSLGAEPEPNDVARMRRLARGSDPLSKRVLAEVELLAGDGAVAERLLTELLAATPNDPELLYLRGMRHVVAARAAEGDARREQYRLARSWLTRAHRADARHFPSLYRYVETFSGEPTFTSDNNVNAVLLAMQLAPQVYEIRMAAGAMLILRGEHEQAQRILEPLASNAHSGAWAQRARALLQKAIDRTSEGVTVEFYRPRGQRNDD
ncbi:MAG TPA: hypothetical protein VF603_05550 [Allosphingosinicella sp.]|jgi:hypothetical protein